MTNKFSENAKRVISGAVYAAKELGHTYVGSEHLLLGIANNSDCTAAKFLYSVGITSKNVKSQIVSLGGIGNKNYVGGEDMTPKCKKILMKASRQTKGFSDMQIGTENILMAILSEECVAKRIIEMEGALPEELYCMLDGMYGDIENSLNCELEFAPKAQTPILDKNARDLTQAARSGKISKIIGREKEEERMIRILLRKTKNNPCLIGEAGVGKTAVAESLAYRIANGNVPKELLSKRIMALDMSSVVAGTKYRGEFEEKLKNIVNEARLNSDIVLFIDELHTIVGAGSAEGSIDAANILKPPLARGEISVIGATTPKEYKRIIERDSALERRFQGVTVGEPSEDDCEKMLFASKKTFESHHKVKIDDSAVKTAVKLSSRYIKDRFLPDKAIDLLDEAAAFLRVTSQSKTPVLRSEDVARLAEETTGIPLKTLTQSESESVLGLEEKLKNRIIGQDKAVKAVCSAVRRAKSGVCNGDRPICTLLFSGKSGVGKTLCCKTLAECLFGSLNSLIRLDMSEFSEPHSVSKLIGSPAGYVGFGEGGYLTEKIRHEPFSLVLFDEIEKAHPDVMNLLLQILDEGRLTDSAGLEVSFKSAFVIMTSNVGTKSSAKSGFVSLPNDEKALASNLLSPELADRVDEIILFAPLGDAELMKIAQNECRLFASRLAEQNIKVKFDESYFLSVSEFIKNSRPSARGICSFVRHGCEEIASRRILQKSLARNGELLIETEINETIRA